MSTARDSLIEAHDVDACYDTGEDWKLVCSCGWEAWGYATEERVRALHAAHVFYPEADRPVSVLD